MLKLIRPIAVLALLISAAGCLSKQEDAIESITRAKQSRSRAISIEDAEAAARSAQAFRVTAYPLVRRDCASCHNTAQAPKFATDQLVPSHQAATPFVNLSSPSASRFVARSIDGHCGTNACRTDGSIMTAAITAWKEKLDNYSAETLDKSTIGLQSLAQTVGEGDGKIEFVIVSGFTEREVSISYQITGTAQSGADFTPPASTTIVIPPFQTITRVELPLLEDLLSEGAESIEIALMNPVGAELSAQANVHIASITDNEAISTVQWSMAALSVTEETAAPAVEVSLNPPSATAVTVQFTVTGTGILTRDYTLGANQITIPAGQTTVRAPITLVGDAIDEDDKTLTLTLTSATGATLGSQVALNLTVTDNDASPSARFTLASQSVNENIATATIAVTLSQASERTVTVPLTLSGTALLDVDYRQPASLSLVFAPGSTATNLVVNLVDDTIYDLSKLLTVTMGNPINATQGAQITHQLTLPDNETQPTIDFSVAAQSVGEQAGQAIVTARLNRASTQTITAALAVSGTSGSLDHTAMAQTVTIAAGTTSTSLTIMLLDDARDEADETLILTLSSPTNATLGAQTIHTVTLTDNDATPSVTWASATRTVTENSGAVTTTLSLSQVSDRTVQVPYTVAGTSSAPADHSLVSGTLTIPAGQTSVTLSFNLVADAVADNNETVTIQLGTPTNATLGATSLHTITISEGAATPSVSFTTASQTITETAGTVSLTVAVTPVASQSVVIPYTIAGTASNPSDHTLASGSLTLASGVAQGTISLPIVNDVADEADETIIVTLGTPTGATLGGTPVHTLTLQSDDAPSIVTVALAAQTVTESATTATINASLNRASGYTVSVPYTISGTATSPSDHNLAQGVFVFTPGQISASISATIVNDTINESSETLILTLGTPTRATLGALIAHTITITDDDAAPLARFAAATRTIGENTGIVTLQVDLDRAGSGAITVPYTVAGTSNGADHTLVAGSLSITAGQLAGSVTFQVTDDAVYEGNETLIVTLGTPTGGATLGTPSDQTITVTDNEVMPTLSWSSAASSSLESAGVVPLTATLSGASSQVVTATIALTGTATSPADYSVSSTTVTFAAGATSATTNLTIVNDALNEASETVVLQLQTPVGATLGTTTAWTVTLTDDDPMPTLQWDLASQSLNESAGAVLIRASLSAASGRAVTVPFTLAGTATATSDYTGAAGTLTIAAGSTSATATITLVDDTELEPSDETILLTLSSPTNAMSGARMAHSLTILDNEIAPTAGMEAFRNSVYVITRRDCASCHALLTSPTHASSDIPLAYSVARPLANFTTPEASTFVSKTRDGHCGTAVCMTDGTEMIQAIQAWALVDTSPNGDAFAFACTPNSDPGPSTVLRLSRTQYLNTLSDLLTRAFSAATVDAFFATAPNQLLIAAVPPDGTGGHNLVYDTQDQRISMLHVQAQFELARAIATWLTQDATRQDTFVRHFGGATPCATITSTGCVDAFITGFGLRTLRRPLDNVNDGDLTFYRNIYNGTQGGYRGLTIAFLMSPGFLFLNEFKGTAVSSRADLTQLTSYEIASKLSYYLTGSMPDEALLTAAEAGFAGAGNTLAAQTTRLLGLSRARAHFRNFYTQWVRPDRVPGLSGSAVTQAMELIYPDNSSSPIPANTDMTALRDNAILELTDLTDYYTFGTTTGKLSDIVTSDISFARTNDLAQLYRVSAWPGRNPDETYNPATLIRFNQTAPRSGLFTRAAFLFAASGDPNSIIRGARLRTEYLCDAIIPAADTSTPAEVVLPTQGTARQFIEARTQTTGTACASCHTARINPLGFALNGFDSLGRFRTQEQTFDQSSQFVSWAAVNTVSQPRIDDSASTTNSVSGVDFSSQLAQSGKLHACFVRDYFKYFVARNEDLSADGCFLESMRQALSDPSTGNLRNLIQQIPLTREFGQRKSAGN